MADIDQLHEMCAAQSCHDRAVWVRVDRDGVHSRLLPYALCKKHMQASRIFEPHDFVSIQDEQYQVLRVLEALG